MLLASWRFTTLKSRHGDEQRFCREPHRRRVPGHQQPARIIEHVRVEFYRGHQHSRGGAMLNNHYISQGTGLPTATHCLRAAGILAARPLSATHCRRRTRHQYRRPGDQIAQLAARCHPGHIMHGRIPTDSRSHIPGDQLERPGRKPATATGVNNSTNGATVTTDNTNVFYSHRTKFTYTISGRPGWGGRRVESGFG